DGDDDHATSFALVALQRVEQQVIGALHRIVKTFVFAGHFITSRQICLINFAAASALVLPGSTASRTVPCTRRVLAISVRRASITLSRRERSVGYETPTCSAISLRFPPARTNISMNFWCSTGKLARRDIGNRASTATLQWAQ